MSRLGLVRVEINDLHRGPWRSNSMTEQHQIHGGVAATPCMLHLLAAVPRRNEWVPDRAQQPAHTGLQGCWAGGPYPAWPAPFLRQPDRVAGGARRCGGADSRP